MRLLVVAMVHSVHTARWLSQLSGLGWDLHLFPSMWPMDVHPELKDVTLHGVGLWRPKGLHPSVKVAGCWPWKRGAYRLQRVMDTMGINPSRESRLAGTLRTVRPDAVHVMEMQHAGYLTMAVRDRVSSPFPPIIYSCWGNDIYFFRHQPVHTDRIRAFLSGCRYLFCDCERDVMLAREWGFAGETLGVFPVGGGFPVRHMQQYAKGPPSTRRSIAVKGYQDDAFTGRARTALEALAQCADVVRDYHVEIYSCKPALLPYVEALRSRYGLRVSVLPPHSHEAMAGLMGRSRLALAVNTSDGSPNTLLEAMILGAFPVQSDTVSTAEWIHNGENGFLVSPEDVSAIAAAVRRGLTDDVLVDQAAERNLRVAYERLDEGPLRALILQAYHRVAADVTRGRTG